MRSHSHKLIHTSFYLSFLVQAFLFFVRAMIGVAEARKLSEDSDDDDDDGKGKGKGDGSPPSFPPPAWPPPPSWPAAPAAPRALDVVDKERHTATVGAPVAAIALSAVAPWSARQGISSIHRTIAAYPAEYRRHAEPLAGIPIPQYGCRNSYPHYLL